MNWNFIVMENHDRKSNIDINIKLNHNNRHWIAGGIDNPFTTWEVNKKYILETDRGISALEFSIIEPMSIKLQLSTTLHSQTDR